MKWQKAILNSQLSVEEQCGEGYKSIFRKIPANQSSIKASGFIEIAVADRRGTSITYYLNMGDSKPVKFNQLRNGVMWRLFDRME